MAKVELSKKTIAELRKEATTKDVDGWPVTEDIDSVILRLIQANAFGNGKPKTVAVTKVDPHRRTRKVNPDDIKVFIRPKYKSLANYNEVVLRVFGASGNDRLGLSSIVNLVFDFPNTPERKGRQFRAGRSLQVALRRYGGKKPVFEEPVKDVYQLAEKR